jgi:hypothetical protein
MQDGVEWKVGKLPPLMISCLLPSFPHYPGVDYLLLSHQPSSHLHGGKPARNGKARSASKTGVRSEVWR